MLRHDIQLPYGAVYFRKSNPPQADWERDYKVAGEDGLNIFLHWFMWSAIEVAPGVYDWAEYDRQLDLAAQNGIKNHYRRTHPCRSGLGGAQIQACPAGQRRWLQARLIYGRFGRDWRLFQ